MKKFLSVLLICVFLVSALSAGLLSYAENTLAAEYFVENLCESDEIQLEKGRSEEDIILSKVIVKASSEPKAFGKAKCIKGYKDHFVYEYSSPELAQKAAEYYESLRTVEWAGVDKVLEAQGYGESMMQTDDAIEYIESNSLAKRRTKLAVIDTGVQVESRFFADNERVIDSGYNFSNTGGGHTSNDDNGHGSTVCGIAFNNTDENVDIVAYKVLNAAGIADDYYVSLCIDAAVNDGVDVINLSLGGEGENEEWMIESVHNAVENNICVVVAAGNEGVDVADTTPASIDEVFTVSALDKYGNEAMFSNYGEGVDFIAPGYEITSAWGDEVEEGSEKNCGTSFSAPYVSAAAAMIKAVNPDYTVAQIEQALIDSCVPYSALNYKDDEYKPIIKSLLKNPVHENIDAFLDLPEDKEIYYGHGMPNLLNAVIASKRADKVKYNYNSGHYVNTDIDLAMSAGANDTIYYSTDNTYPIRQTSESYSGRLSINENVGIRAIAYNNSTNQATILSDCELEIEHIVADDEVEITANGAVTAYYGNYSNLIFPEKLKGITVKSLGVQTSVTSQDAMSFNCPIYSLRLPETCKGIYLKRDKGTYINPYNLKYLYAEGLTSVYTPITDEIVELYAPKLTSFSTNSDKVKELYLPNVSGVNERAFDNCLSLKKVTLADGAQLGAYAFSGCCYLKEVVGSLLTIGSGAFNGCVMLERVDFSALQSIGSYGFSNVRKIRYMNCPKLEQEETLALPMSLNTLIAPKLKRAASMPFMKYGSERPKMFVSNAFENSGITSSYYDSLCMNNSFYSDFFHGDRCWDELIIYGYKDSFAEFYADNVGLEFRSIPALVSEPENMAYANTGEIKAEVFGFNLRYQWYATDYQMNKNGVILPGETSDTLNTDLYYYNYYYCVIKAGEGEGEVVLSTGWNVFDIVEDNVIDIMDINALLLHMGESVDESNKHYDFNSDSVVDMADLSLILCTDIYGK